MEQGWYTCVSFYGRKFKLCVGIMLTKYVTFDSQDEYGEHVVPIDRVLHSNTKLASQTYSPDLMKVIHSLKKKPELYYVVINALGSYEVWGGNGNGDAFPREGLKHVALRTDMNTVNDYGLKTFEYYSKLFKHHANLRTSPNFGEVIFAHWNALMERGELIVGIDKFMGKSIIEDLDNGENVAVSMGCFTDPKFPILVKDQGYVNISDVKVGDLVLTHKGNWKKVNEVMQRPYTGMVHEFKVKGLPFPIELTDEHPLMTKSFKAYSKYKRRPYADEKDFESVVFEWDLMKDVEIGDHVQYLGAQYNEHEYTKVGDIDLARIMGFYLAEGSIQYSSGNENCVYFTCHIDSEIVRIIPKILNKSFPDVTCSVKPKNNSKMAVTVEVFSARLARFLKSFIWTGSHDKTIPPEIFVSDQEVKLAFLGAWLSGDGWCDKKGVHWSTCNRSLALLGRDLLISCSIPSSIYMIKHPAGGGFNHHETTEYTLNISKFDASPLLPYSEMKLAKLNDYLRDCGRRVASSIRMNADNTRSYSVKEINSRYVENVVVYNFEVEDDNSYSAGGLVSHNCRVKYDRCNICNNKAATRKQYCKHAKNYLGKIIDHETAEKWSKELGRKILAGTRVVVYNDFPKFFDISIVNIGADRVSFILGKAASESHIISSIDLAEVYYEDVDQFFDKIAQVKKQSDIKKQVGALGPDDIDGKVAPIGEQSMILKALKAKVKQSIEAEPEIAKGTLNTISNFPLSTILSSMTNLGIHPSPREFQRIVLVNVGEKRLADKLDDANMVFDHKEPVKPHFLNISKNNTNNFIMRLLSSIIPERSCYPHFLEPRIKIIMIKTANNTLDDLLGLEESTMLPKAMLGIAALYAGLKMRSSGLTPRQIGEAFAKNSMLRGAIGGTAMGQVFDKIYESKDPDVDIPAIQLEGLLKDTKFSGITKGAKLNIANALGYGILASGIALPAAYISNVYNQRSLRTTGRPLYSGAGINPITVSVGAGVGAMGATLGINKLKNILTKVK